jgi:YVTN family beta-propeller protein
MKTARRRLAPAALAASAVAIGLTATATATAQASPASPFAARATAATPPTMYVVNEGGLVVPGTVTPIPTSTGIPGPTINVGGVPFRVAITPNGATAYVTDISRNLVIPVATGTDKAGKPIKVGDGPFALTIIPNGKEVYVANDDSNSVTVINAASGKTATFGVGAYPTAMVAAANGNTVYSVGLTQMSAISTTTNKARPPAFIGAGTHDLVISPDSKTLYVSNGNALAQFSAATLKLTRTLRVGANQALALAPNGQTLYAIGCPANQKTGTITPIATATLRPGKPVSLGFCSENDAFSPDGKTLYLVDSPVGSVDGAVVPFATVTNKTEAPITVGEQPDALALLPGATAAAASTLYVLNTGSGSVTPVNTATGTAGAAIPVGYLPTAIAIAR